MRGKPGFCPPLADIGDYHVAVTTPYILTETTKTDWTAYLNRAMLNMEVKDEGHKLYELLKYGSWTHHWNEFVLNTAYFLMNRSHYRRLKHMKRSKIVSLVHQVTKDGNSQISKVKKIAAKPKERK